MMVVIIKFYSKKLKIPSLFLILKYSQYTQICITPAQVTLVKNNWFKLTTKTHIIVKPINSLFHSESKNKNQYLKYMFNN